MTTANEKILDAIVERQISYIAYATGVTDSSSPFLRKTEDEIRTLIYSYYGRIEENPLYSRQGRSLIRELEAKITTIRAEAWTSVFRNTRDELRQVAALEASTLAATIQSAVPVSLGLALPATEVLAAVVVSQPFEGKVLKDWINGGGAADINMITGRIKDGLVQGRTADEVVKEILGTTSSGRYPRNAMIRKAERDMLAIVLTGVSSVSNEARNQLYESNSDVINEVIFVATLDSHTTFECADNDAKVFPLGKSPKPPLHFRCRSAIVPYVNPDNLLTRPFNPTTEKQLLREYSEKNGLSIVGKRSKLPYGHKTKFDNYGRGRLRELVGQVPAKTSFDDFLRRRSNEFQDNYLGPARAKLYRDDPTMKMSKFVANNGRTLTLKELNPVTN
jgi:hypothetical protein